MASAGGLDGRVAVCPFCGGEVEIFSDETSHRCKCGEQVPHSGGLNVTDTVESAEGPFVPAPPPQDHFSAAARRAARLLVRQSPEQLRWLGAVRNDDRLRLAVLDDALHIHLPDGQVLTSDDCPVCPQWRLLVLHYLMARARPLDCEPAITFADLPDGLAYARVYQPRVIGRLCATAGRNADSLRPAAVALGGTPADAGNMAFDFDIFPRLSLRLVWYAPDDEFDVSATILLPRDIGELLNTEDIVVLSEQLVARLAGHPF